MTRECTKCHTIKSTWEFAWHNKVKGTLQSWCRACVSLRDKNEAPKRRERKRYTNKLGVKRRKVETTQEVLSYLSWNPCVDCGEKDAVVLDFDHRDPGKKRTDIANLIAVGYSWEAIKIEIDKCDVRCANCHRRKTAKERGTLRWRLSRGP